MKPPVSVGAFRKLVKELQAAGRDRRPLVVGGASELAFALERELLRGGDPSAVRVGSPEGAAVYVHIATGGDEQAVREAERRHVPVVAVELGAGEPLAVERIAAQVAARLGEAGAPLAARLPALRGAVCDRIVAAAARKNGIVAAAVFVPGADLPVLALNQVRMLLLLDQAHGLELDYRERLPEVLAIVGAGFGLRTLARELLDVVPVAGWAVKGGVAYAGTRALGEAAIKRLESVH